MNLAWLPEIAKHQIRLEKLRQLHRDMRCLRRAFWWMVLLGALAVAGLCYSTVLAPHLPQTLAQFRMQFAVQACSTLGLASSICLVTFASLELVYHKKLGRLLRISRHVPFI